MQIRKRAGELAVWSVLAFCGGAIAGSADLTAQAVQRPVLLLMLASFALTLPGRAPFWLVAICAWLAMPVVHWFANQAFNPGIVIALLPAFIAAVCGSLAGRLLETNTVPRSDDSDAGSASTAGVLSTRVVLSVTLLCIAAAGIAPTREVLAAAGHPLASWLAMVWQVLTLLGWIACARLVMTLVPPVIEQEEEERFGINAADLVRHVLTILALAAIHATVLVTITRLLLIPLTPSSAALVRAAAIVYLPLDALTYVAVVSLAHASDAERQRRNAERREAAARAESLDSRLAVLRARLDPHFLFNALNSVHALARSGRTEQTSRAVEGLADLLRYVLDETRAFVPVRDELAFVTRYLEMQRVRFGDRLRYEVVAEPGAERALVPQLILQPIVENAVHHGVSETIEGGTVAIHAQCLDDLLRVIVDDEGRGEPGGNGMGIGLANTRERLAVLFPERARVNVEPRSSGGTRVTIEMPLKISEQP